MFTRFYFFLIPIEIDKINHPMKKHFAFTMLVFTCNINLFSQTNFPSPESPAGINTTGHSGTGANYDVKYQKMWFRINPDSALYLKGSVQTNFLTIQNNVSAITFDLHNAFTVDSVYYENAKLPTGNYSLALNILSIDLGVSLAINTLDSVTVYYQGVPPASPPGYPEGLKQLSSAGGNYIMSVSESYEDRDWFPCKADMQDKIDTLEIKLNVPWAYPAAADTFWGIANGMLIDSAIVGNSRTFTYHSNYPIASYLVGISVGRFNRYYRGTVDINGTNVPIIYYLLAGRTTAQYNTNLTALDKMNLVLSAYSQKFGDYPFKKEKHGYYDGLVNAGGIEHQTSSCIAISQLNNLSTLAHELMHQWFGDNVSFSTWNDLWLAEGFAQYSEALVGELVPSLGINPYNTRNSIKNEALNDSTHSAWIPDANAATTVGIWGSNYGTTIYKRGAMAASMLRTLCGDAKYFQALKNYQSNRALQSATTDTLKNYFNEILGTDISQFFKDYIGGSGPGATAVGGLGHPKYSINWFVPSSKILTVSVNSQMRTTGSNVSYFHAPVVLHVKGATPAQDTTIAFFDWGGGNLSYAGNGLSAPVGGNLLTYPLSFDPVTVIYDDSARTLSTGYTTNSNILAVKILNFTGKKVKDGNQLILNVVKDLQINRAFIWRSADGINFSPLGEMIISPNSGQQSAYSFTDPTISGDAFFYKAEIGAGSGTFSKIVKLDGLKAIGLTLSPNPAGGFTNISFDNIHKEPVVIHVLNSAGRIVLNSSTNTNYLQLNLNNLSNGLYEVQLFKNNELLQNKKLIIQR
ncbi:MAG: T9SS type A sorting domain-containing protein [Bacteroidota bacterium]|nr:T9SS type A sorting domain-containing protein [Bacteroidota bacterium]